MPYIRQEWINGETHLDADHMNHMEDGIERVNNRLDVVEPLLSRATTAAEEAIAAAEDAAESAEEAKNFTPTGYQSLVQSVDDLSDAVDAKITTPSGGTTGQILTKTATGEAWEDVDISDHISGTLATIESTSTASKAYAEGDYLVYNGILYKVISAINSGDTLTPNTNIEATTTSAELTALNNDLEMHYRDYDALEDEYVTVNPSIIDTSTHYSVEIWNRRTEAYMQVSFNLKTAVSNNTTVTVLNFTSKITELIHRTGRTYPGFIEGGTYGGRSCVLHLDTWNDTKKLEMYNGLGGAIPVGTRMTFAFYVMQ